MSEELKLEKYGYSLRPCALNNLLQKNGYTFYDLAEKMNISAIKLRKMVYAHEKFNREEIRKLVYFLGAYDGLNVIYFPDKAEKRRVYYQIFDTAKEEILNE